MGEKARWLSVFGVSGAVVSRLSAAEDETSEDSGFTMDAPRPGKAGSGSIKVNAVYSLHWEGPVPEANMERRPTEFLNGDRTTVGVVVPGKGWLSVVVHLEGTEDISQDITAAWNIAADAEGALKIASDGSPEYGHPKEDATVWVESATQDSSPPTASLNLILAGKSETETSGTSTTVSGGGEGKVKGVGVSGGVSHSWDDSTSTSTPNPKVQKAIRVTFNPVKLPAPKKPPPPPPPEPKGTVTVDKTVVVDQEFVIGPFSLGDAKKLDSKNMGKFNPMGAQHLNAASVKEAVLMLYDALPDETRNSLDNGKLAGDEAGSQGKKIRIVGYADNVGESDFNIDLSTQRAQEVLEEFKRRGVPDNCFQLAHGEGNKKTPKPTGDSKQKQPLPDPDWRKVVIAVRWTATAKGDE